MTDNKQVLDELFSRYLASSAEEQAKARKAVEAVRKQYAWRPIVGPQTEAYQSKADVLLYGGSAGGGKTALLLGLAFTQHRRSLILRRQYTDLASITDLAIKINGGRKGFNGAAPPRLRTADGRQIDFGACARPGDEEGFQGQPHDLIGFDEAVHFHESQIRFLMTWLRTTDQGQRCRVVLASNPPVSSEGTWIISMFGPWLDPTHSDPAKPGELRWFISDENGKDKQVDGPEPVMIGGKTVKPLSRTFIPAKLSDNPHLVRTDYGKQLDTLQEPYRSALRDGNFMLARRDTPDQLIPTQWLLDAQARWTPTPPPGVPMCAIGVDVAAGGEDNTVEAIRYDSWYAPLIVTPGVKTPTGPDVAGLVISHRRDNAMVIVDMGGGFGGSAFDHLKANEVDVRAHKGAEASVRRTADKQLGFWNKRAETYWKFREALDPSQPGGSAVALPNDPVLMAELSAPTFEVTPRGIKIETKEDVVKKLGHSPDRADAVVIAWSDGGKIETHYDEWKKNQSGRSAYGRRLRANVIRAHDTQRTFLRR